jgi:polyphenol oxidase
MTAGAATSTELSQRSGLPVLAWPALGARGADVIVTTRQGGVSAGPYDSLNLSFSVGDDEAAVLANRHRAAAAMGVRLSDLVFARQVHGGLARVVGAADRGRGTLTLADAIDDTDALVTADPAAVLAVLVADCVPIVLYDPAARVLAVVHAGWRGTAAGVNAAALAAMSSLGARPGSVLAGLGPAIGADRYQVGADVRDAMIGCLGSGAGAVLRPDGTGRWLLDLRAASRALLVRSGVPESQIHTAAVPTGPDPGLFFSDRTARPCGRFALIARMAEPGGLAGPAGQADRRTG